MSNLELEFHVGILTANKRKKWLSVKVRAAPRGILNIFTATIKIVSFKYPTKLSGHTNSYH